MDEKELWQKFCEGGKIADYLEYRNCVNTAQNTELSKNGEIYSPGARYKGTEYR